MGNTAGVAINIPALNVNSNITVNVSVATSHEGNTAAPWVITGAASGAALGATLGGPAGALIGAAAGASAGLIRVHLGRRDPEARARSTVNAVGVTQSRLSAVSMFEAAH